MRSRERELENRAVRQVDLHAGRGSQGVACGVGPLRDEDRSAVVSMLARAFCDNPINLAVIRGGPRKRLRVNRYGMRATLESLTEKATILVARGAGRGSGGEIEGALLALPPPAHPLPSPPLLAQLRCALGQGLGVARRWGQVYRELEVAHPLEPHWHLALLGVDPERQGRGIGSKLLTEWLAEVDAGAAPAYLETDRQESLRLYARVGFRTLESRRLMGVPIWLLWRVGAPGT